MDIQELLSLTVRNKASDLHLMVGIPPAIRLDGILRYITTYSALRGDEVESMIFSLLTPEQKELLLTNKELDFSIGFNAKNGGEIGRFRINAYFERGYLSAALRFLAPGVRTVEELNLPKVLHDFAKLRQGFVIVAGPTGHGKTSTIAAILNEINQNHTRPASARVRASRPESQGP